MTFNALYIGSGGSFLGGAGRHSGKKRMERQLRALEQQRFSLTQQINNLRHLLGKPQVRLELIPVDAPAPDKATENPLLGADPAQISKWLTEAGLSKRQAATVKKRLKEANEPNPEPKES